MAYRSTATIGDPAFLDCFSGLVPCKTLSLQQGEYGAWRLKVQITDDQGPYKKGEVVESSPLWVIPKWAVKRQRYSTVITHYKWANPKQPTT